MAAAARSASDSEKAVRTTLKLHGMELTQFDANCRASFVRTMQEQLAAAGGIDGAVVSVVSASAGSVVVDCEVVPPTGASAGVCCDAVTEILQGEGGAAALADALGVTLGVPTLSVSVVKAPCIAASKVDPAWLAAAAEGAAPDLKVLQNFQRGWRERGQVDPNEALQEVHAAKLEVQRRIAARDQKALGEEHAASLAVLEAELDVAETEGRAVQGLEARIQQQREQLIQAALVEGNSGETLKQLRTELEDQQDKVEALKAELNG